MYCICVELNKTSTTILKTLFKICIFAIFMVACKADVEKETVIKT